MYPFIGKMKAKGSKQQVGEISYINIPHSSRYTSLALGRRGKSGERELLILLCKRKITLSYGYASLTAFGRLPAMETRARDGRLLVYFRDRVFVGTTFLSSHCPGTDEIFVLDDTPEGPLQRLFAPLLQSEGHPRLERIDVRLVFDDLCQDILRLLFPVALRPNAVGRPRFILTTRQSKNGGTRN